MKGYKTLFFFIVAAASLIVGCSQSNEIDVEILWSKEDVRATGELIDSGGGLMLTREVTLFMQPPYYKGKMPLKFIAVMKNIAPGMSMSEIPLQYIFEDRGYGVLFLYKDRMSLYQRMPKGAVAVDLDTKTIIAECKVINTVFKDKYLSAYELRENHYNKNGMAVFASTFKVDPHEGFKQSESNTLGKKEVEYFFLWPGVSGTF